MTDCETKEAGKRKEKPGNVTAETGGNAENEQNAKKTEDGAQLAATEGAVVGGQRCHASPVPVEEGLAAGDGDVSGQHLEGGGLPGSVDSQQPKTLADTTGRRQSGGGCLNTAALLGRPARLRYGV